MRLKESAKPKLHPWVVLLETLNHGQLHVTCPLACPERSKHEAARIHAAAKQLVPMRMVGTTDAEAFYSRRRQLTVQVSAAEMLQLRKNMVGGREKIVLEVSFGFAPWQVQITTGISQAG